VIENLTHSLRFRITAGVLITLLAILSLFFYVHFAAYQLLLMRNLQSSATNTNQVIQGSLEHAMMSNDLATIQQIIDDIGRQAGVRALFILDKKGHVAISRDHGMVGQTLDMTDATCQACHRYQVASRSASTILTDSSGLRVFRSVNAIENKAECTSCHSSGDPLLGVLISDFDLRPVDQALATARRSNLLWAIGLILLALYVVNMLMNNIVIKRLERLAKGMRRVDEGDLSIEVPASRDEIGVLGRAFNHMVEGLREKRNLELSNQIQASKLENQTHELAMLNDLAGAVSRSLNLQEILYDALDHVLGSMGLRIGWVFLRDGEEDSLRLAAARGLGDSRVLPGECALESCFERQELLGPGREGAPAPCWAIERLGDQSPALRACIPLQSKGRVLGVMALAGSTLASPQGPVESEAGTLAAIGRQIGMAVENSSLYEALREKEVLRRQLLERVITAQEEERKRVARELHDQMSQPLSSLIMTLEVLEKPVPAQTLLVHVQDMRGIAMQMLDQVHSLALQLRPSVLDDLGLLAALRQYFREFQDRFHLPVDFQPLGLANQRLPAMVETALYRIVQEALSNVARHAQARSVGVLLEHRGSTVLLMVEDDGKGFDVTQVMGSSLRTSNLGLYGMQERSSLLGGTLAIESTPGAGTALFVEIPLDRGTDGHAQDTPTGSR
jgi:signal transduction histidine kinase